MRRFLYITPYFPPQRKVGALRPLKFVRHLPDYGWDPIVLCDLRRDDILDRSLLETVPKNIEIIRNYGLFSRYANRRCQKSDFTQRHRKGKDKPRIKKSSVRKPWNVIGQILKTGIPSPRIFNPEIMTFLRHSLDIRHGCKVARTRLRKGDCEAIVVNADPFAALLVGRRLALEFNLPLILDLRDPWAPCDIRRKLRPRLQLRLFDKLERRVMESATKVILNTQETLVIYRKQYSDLPEDRFTLIRNFGDPDLVVNGNFSKRKVFTSLYLGNFRRFVEGEQLIFALAELKQRGFDGSHFQLIITGKILPKTLALFHKLGVEGLIDIHPFISYKQVGPFMETSDLLVLIGHRTHLRIPAKLYDYIQTSRPILAISDNPEISDLANRIGGITVVGLDDINGIADAIQNEVELGRMRTVDHDTTGLDSLTAAKHLATILDEACSG